MLGNLTEIVAPGGATWGYAYDELCRLTRTTDPTGATWLREYDTGGNLTASVDPAGLRYQAGYDQTGRVTSLHSRSTAASAGSETVDTCSIRDIAGKDQR